MTGIALFASLLVVLVEHSSRTLSTKKLALAAIGAFFGLTFSHLFSSTLPKSLFKDPETPVFASNLLFMYFGIVMAMRHADRISLSRLRVFVNASGENSVLVDTSALIDGRLIKLYQNGFMTRSTIIPSFVIDELQRLADSRDPMKRHSGRRGLDNLAALQETDRSYQLFEKDYHDVQGVDHKLIVLAKEIGAPIISTDFNLCKVARLHKIRTLNVNEIAAAVRLNLATGDQAVVTIQTPGKEEGQGVGHLDDGTMVIVERGRELIGQQVNVVIASIVQTKAGRLAFARILDREPAAQGPQSGSVARIQVLSQTGGG
jgi:uncharacterized protein YacL